MGSLQFTSVIRVFTYTFCIISQQGIASYLTYWLELVKASDLNEFNNFFTSFTAWTKQLTNDYLLLYSNGYTKGTNNKIKVLKWISYRLRHFGRFRIRILLLSKKWHQPYIWLGQKKTRRVKHPNIWQRALINHCNYWTK